MDQKKMNSLINSLGNLLLASRLKTLSEKLMNDINRIYKEKNLNFEASWFLVFYQLSLKSPMSITEIAEAIGITHPAVNQIAAKMLKAKIIEESFDNDDKRKRLLSISDEGKNILDMLKPVWEDIENATAEISNSRVENFLQVINNIENDLNKRDLYARVNERFKKRLKEKIDNLEYKPDYQKYNKNIDRNFAE
jgi:DNA-binding MarR family transcriptional regulator